MSKLEEDNLRSSYTRYSAMAAGSEVFEVKYGTVKAKFLSHSPNFKKLKSFGGWGGIPTVDLKR